MPNELVTKSFQSQCLAFPARVDQALAEVTTVQEAKGLLDQAATMSHYAERLKAGIEIERPIAIGVLKIKAKLGELLPAKPPSDRGQGRNGKKSTTAGVVDFNPSVISAYRKLAKHREKLEAYYAEVDDVPTQGGFLQFIADADKSRKRQKRDSGMTPPDDNAPDFMGPFTVIYADPPWQYGNQGTRAATNNHYPTMPTEEIASLEVYGKPISELAAEKSILYIWTTNGFLEETLQTVIPAWGFTFKSSMVWVKPQIGIGNYVRNAHELLLIANRGGYIPNGKNQISWIEADRKAHSAKPDCFRHAIEKMAPAPRIELFARQQRPGWHAWGNQVRAMEATLL